MAGSTRSETAAALRRARARRLLASIPWPTESARVQDQVRRAMRLSSEERFRAQLTLLGLVDPRSAAMAAAKRWHDRQDAIERQRFSELFERHERKRRCH